MIEIDKSQLKNATTEVYTLKSVIEFLGKENCDLIINSIDKENAFPYIIALTDKVVEYAYKQSPLSYYSITKQKYDIKQELERLKVFLFKQRKILVAVPQRQKHPNFPAPNMGGFSIPQNIQVKGEVCYGLGYCDARTFLVEKALENPEITDILFLDDDVLLPLSALTELCACNEAIIACNYTKKKFPTETTAFAIDPKTNHNKEIKATQNDMTPKAVSQMGLGACLISLDVFRKIPKPWFEFIYNKDGSPFAGEDVRFCQKAILAGFNPKVIPGLVPVHVDLKTGKHWGPDWLIEDFELKREFKDEYCYFMCDPTECAAEDVK
jgi:hypothetical protein